MADVFMAHMHYTPPSFEELGYHSASPVSVHGGK